MMRTNVLHVIHDFLPRHQAGSEIYAYELCRKLSHRHHVTVLCAEYDPSRRHGELVWRVHGDLPVIELINNWHCRSFEDTYRDPVVTERLGHVLEVIQPDILHVHSLFNLSFDLPALARSRGIPVVATLHDYTLVCPSGGQRIHRADQHVCAAIDPHRCARCFRESPFFSQMSYAKVTTRVPARGSMLRIARALRHWMPTVTSRIAAATTSVGAVSVTEEQIADRLTRARQVFDDIELLVSPSQFLADEFVRLGVRVSKIRVSANGYVPLRRMNGHEGNGAGGLKRPLRLGYVGTIVWHKGLHMLIEALRGLPRDAYELKVFGSLNTFPDYAADLRRRAVGLPIRWMDEFSHGDASDAYRQIDVLVVPSIWLENSPLVIHEAFMAGVPVVAARIGGMAGLVSDGTNGLLYDAHSSDALAAALRQLIDHPDAVQALARHVPQVKSIADDAADWERRYAEVLEPRVPRLPA